MNTLKNALIKIKTQVLLFIAKYKVSKIYYINDSTQLLQNAIRAVLYNDITQTEKTWINKIETLRKELNSSTDEIEIMDYGAGKPNIHLTTEQMYLGRMTKKTIGSVCSRASRPYIWTLLLFKLIREFKPKTCLELGTCLGISGCYQSAALKLNKSGNLITIEGAESLAAIATQNFHKLNLDNVQPIIGRFQDTLANILEQQAPIDFAFIDGHHDEQATLNYFKQITLALSDRAILILDDISWSKGMNRTWQKIKSDDRVKVSVDLGRVGICIFDTEIKKKQIIRIPFG